MGMSRAGYFSTNGIRLLVDRVYDALLPWLVHLIARLVLSLLSLFPSGRFAFVRELSAS